MKPPVDQRIKAKEAELLRLKNKVRSQRTDGISANISQATASSDSHPIPQSIHSNQPSRNAEEAIKMAYSENNPEPRSREQEDRGNRTDELKQALKRASGKKLLICIKGYPDPDNIASSLALQWIARRYDIQSHIIHFESISHQENRALVKKLDLDIEQINDGFDFSTFDFYAINDAQSTELPVKLPVSCELLVFVDHHKSLGTVQGQFVDIRESAGSTSGIYGEYLMDKSLGFTGEDTKESKIATAMMHGIRSDTDNFVNATNLDYKSSGFLSKFVDKDLLALISQQSIPAKTMDLTQVALQRKDIKGTFMFSGVGFVRDEDRDGIGQCADYLLHREGIDTVVVYGVVGGQFIDGSLRTKSHTLDPDKWLKDVFGQDRHGNYYGGGRKDKGGFQIPLQVFANCSDKELLWILIKKTIDELFYQKIGVEGSSNLDTD